MSQPQPADSGGETTDRGGLAEVMGQVALRLRNEHQPVEATLNAITAAAVTSVPGATDAGVTLVTDGHRVQARAATSDRPADLDALQDRLGEGPCLDAVRDQEVVHIRDVAAEDRWPRFAAAAAEHGVGSMVALQLFVTGRKLGALNLYAPTPHAFGEESETAARVFTIHAAIALAAAEREHHLEAALRSRDLIGQAKGILMERYKFTADEAFDLLARVSSITNRRLRDIAEEIAATGAVPS